ncbi:unnamed protein product [Musa textilis]
MNTYRVVRQSWILYPLLLLMMGISVLVLVILMSQIVEHTLEDANEETLEALVSQIKDHSNLLLRANTFTYEAAKALSWEENLSSFFTTGSKIVPQLYVPFLMEQWVAQISYIEPRGILFSYYHDGNQSYNLFSNVSRTSDDFFAYSWCTQALDGENGKPYGKIVCLQPGHSNDSKDASNGKKGEASWGVGWGNAKEQMLFFTAPVAKSGILSLGVPLRSFRDSISSINLQGGCFYLAVEGHIIAQNRLPRTHFVYNDSMMSVLVMDENDTNVLKEYDSFACHDNISIRPSNTNYLSILGKRYQLDCFLLNVFGVQMVYAVTLPDKKVVPLFLKMKIVIVLLVLFMILGTILGSYVMLQLLQRAQLHETFLRADLIKQKGIIQQAERKSMNKSLAFASASHDIRTSLAGITGLIEICRSDTPQNSEMYRNLEQMNGCVSKLLGILNSVLDISKIEAGKMQLEEVEFDIAHVFEESVDIFHVVALKKGLEVIWDPCDCSILLSSNVKGDCRRLKQIIDNLLGNAVKFTSEGHVVLRAWAKKSSLENLRCSSRNFCNSRNAFSPLLRWISKDKEDQSLIQNDNSLIEIIIEVDDTGMGIPKEKRASVFENYVQVKESSNRDYEGTGLGLGIVQSYVRLMGGEIKIQDKDPSERGTCFRFNIFLKSSASTVEGEEKDEKSNILCMESNTQIIQSNARTLAFKRGLSVEGIHSLLMVEGDETKRIMQRWIQNLGVKVWAINHWEILYPTLEKIKDNFNISGKFDTKSLFNFLNTTASYKSSREKEDIEIDNALPSTNMEFKNGFGGLSIYWLIVVEYIHANFSEIASALKNFTDRIPRNHYKIVWLLNSNTPSEDLRRSKEVPCDLILQKPIHGSRLYLLLRLLQDFGRENEDHILDKRHNTGQYDESNSFMESDKFVVNSSILRSNQYANQIFGSKDSLKDEKPLKGINVLLVEDVSTLRHVATTMLARLGATIKSSENGLDALNLIRDALRKLSPAHERDTEMGESKHFYYDVIIMDCEMPIMNGYEATRQIRQEERTYGLHIPIIALTAHATFDEENKSILSGMDFHLTKPIQAKELIHAITTVCQ